MSKNPENTEDKKISKIDREKEVFVNRLITDLEEIGKNYGPVLMNELLKRLEKVVENFNEEFITLVKSSFKKWKIKDFQLRKIMAHEKNEDVKKGPKVKKESTKSPDFIKDVKFGPTKNK